MLLTVIGNRVRAVPESVETPKAKLLPMGHTHIPNLSIQPGLGSSVRLVGGTEQFPINIICASRERAERLAESFGGLST